MLGWLTNRSYRPTREALLAAIPAKNQLVRESRRDKPADLAAAALRLTAPLERRGVRGFFRSASDKSFDLDELGAFVWDALNGRRSVEALIHLFAEEKRVNAREAEIAVLAFLKTLAQRNLIALAVDGSSLPRTKRRRRKRKNK